MPTSPLSQINSYQNYAASTPSRTPSTQSSSLQVQRQQYTNQISQAAQRESSTARAWGGGLRKRQLEAERRKIEVQLHYANDPRAVSGTGQPFVDLTPTNPTSEQNSKRIKYVLKNAFIPEDFKVIIKNYWNEIVEQNMPRLVPKDPLKAWTSDYYAPTHGIVLAECNKIVKPVYNQLCEWEKEILLPILRQHDFKQANTLTSKSLNQEQWLKNRRKLEKHHSNIKKILIIKKHREDIRKKTDEEYEKIRHNVGYIDHFWLNDTHNRIRWRIEREFFQIHLDELSHQKNLEHQQKLAAEKLAHERQLAIEKAEIERQLAAERAEQERIKKAVELAQKKSECKISWRKIRIRSKKNPSATRI